MSYTVEIDQELCISSGKCVADGSGVFAFDDEELAYVENPDHGLDTDRLIRIARNCPSQAVILRDEHGDVVTV
jgi:ferredoxin